MSDKNWLGDADLSWDKLLEKQVTYVDRCAHIKEVAIFPNDLMILPFEQTRLSFSDPNAKRLFDDVLKGGIHLGIGLREKGDNALPAVGSIGVGADIVEKDGKRQLTTKGVEIRGVVRFIIDEYIETDKPYPIARITFFEDAQITNELEKRMFSDEADRLRTLMRQFCRRFGQYRHLDNLANTIENRDLQMYSFFFWFLFAPVPQDIRQPLLEMRSTVQRIFVLNGQLERTIARAKK